MISLIKYRPLLLLALFISCQALSQERREIPKYKVFGAAENKEEASQIEQLTSGYISAWQELDSNALIALHARDTEWTNAFARMFQSSKALAIFLENRLFPQFEKSLAETEGLEIMPISLRYLGDSAAVIHLYTEFHGNASRNADEALRRTHFHLVLEQRGSEWKIVHTAIMDAR